VAPAGQVGLGWVPSLSATHLLVVLALRLALGWATLAWVLLQVQAIGCVDHQGNGQVLLVGRRRFSYQGCQRDFRQEVHLVLQRIGWVERSACQQGPALHLLRNRASNHLMQPLAKLQLFPVVLHLQAHQCHHWGQPRHKERRRRLRGHRWADHRQAAQQVGLCRV